MTPAALVDLVRSVAHDVLTGRGLDSAALPPTVTVTRPRDPAHGDYATNVALQTGKQAGVAPREFAGWLARALVQRPGVRSAEVAGPGFLNLRLAADAQSEIVALILATGERFGISEDIDLDTRTHDVISVQYAHARLASLARNAADLGISPTNAQLELLDHQREGELIRTLGEFPRIVSLAARRHEPHRVDRYLEELAGVYHRFSDTCRVLPMGQELPNPRHGARLALCEATRQVLANGLGLIGVSAPERM
ncbi:MAG: DALR anticodon-binding domain-containing protein [Pseudonocardiaceae bacterium]